MLIQVDKAISEEAAHKKWLEGLYWELRSGIELEKFNYLKKRKQELGAANQGKAAQVEGLGQLVAEYDPRQWFRWRQEDEHFWDDNTNVEKFKKDNPEVVVTKW